MNEKVQYKLTGVPEEKIEKMEKKQYFKRIWWRYAYLSY